MTFRIAFGPRDRQKVLTLRGTMPRGSAEQQPLCADIHGFSLNAAARVQQRARPGVGRQIPQEPEVQARVAEVAVAGEYDVRAVQSRPHRVCCRGLLNGVFGLDAAHLPNRGGA